MTAVHLTRSLPAPVDRVWTAVTDPVALMQWFWPKSFGTKAVGQLHTGGAYAIRSDAMEMGVSGEYQVVEPPHRLVFTWQWDGESEVSVVTIDLTDLGDHTELSLTHERLADEASRTAHAQGWNDCFDRLPDWLAAA